MRAHHLSMSRVGLAHLCSWSFRADAPQHPRPAGKEARIGSGSHKAMELYVTEGEVVTELPGMDPTEAAESLAFFSPAVRAWLDKTPWTSCEIGMRYDTRADATTLGPRRGEPGYDEIGESVVPGTLDLVSVEQDTITVVDAKTGKKPTDMEQLYVQAVAASRYYGVSRARVGYLMMRKTKCAEPEWETLDADALDIQAGRLSRLVRRLPMAEPVAGDYCWRCDARPSCPAYGAAQEAKDASELEAAGFFG